MALINRAGQEISAKVVYYGPGLSGKTTNLEVLFKQVPEEHRGKMISMKTRTDRTLFFDLLPLNADPIGDYQVRILLYTVPGQVYYNATRRLVLKGVDALVFVADSQRGKLQENLESLENLRSNLVDMGLKLDELPWVIQYNKRDLPDILSTEELDQALNPQSVPSFEGVAPRGDGVHETLRGVADHLRPMLEQQVMEETSNSASPEMSAGGGEDNSGEEVITPDTPGSKPSVEANADSIQSSVLESIQPAPLEGTHPPALEQTQPPPLEQSSETAERSVDLDKLPDPLVVELPLTGGKLESSRSPAAPPFREPDQTSDAAPDAQVPSSDSLQPSSPSRDLGGPPGFTPSSRPEDSCAGSGTEPAELLVRVPPSLLESGELRLRIVIGEEKGAPPQSEGELLHKQ